MVTLKQGFAISLSIAEILQVLAAQPVSSSPLELMTEKTDETGHRQATFQIRSTERKLLLGSRVITAQLDLEETEERTMMTLRFTGPPSDGPFVKKLLFRFHETLHTATGGDLGIVIDTETFDPSSFR